MSRSRRMRSSRPRLTGRLRVKQPRAKRILNIRRKGAAILFDRERDSQRGIGLIEMKQGRSRSITPRHFDSLSSQGSSPVPFIRADFALGIFVYHRANDVTANLVYASYLSHKFDAMNVEWNHRRKHRHKYSEKTFFSFFIPRVHNIFQGPVDRPAFFNENRGMFHNTYNWNESRDCFMLG